MTTNQKIRKLRENGGPWDQAGIHAAGLAEALFQ
jgi:hypothetical protein